MIQTSLKQKILLVLGSVLVTVFLVESALLAGRGIFLLRQRRRNNAAFKAKGVYRILCIGESTTYLGGENHYPNYLSEILNGLGLKGSVVVINKGTPGISTDFIVKNIENWIERYQPDIVVSMIGINDAMLISDSGEGNHFIPSIVKRTQTYKLIKRIVSALKTKTPDKPSEIFNSTHFLKGEVNEAGDIYTEDLYGALDKFWQAMSKLPYLYEDRYNQAVILEGLKEYELVELIYLSFLVETDDEHIHHWIYQKVGRLLQLQGRYMEFVGLMPKIAYGYWGSDWIDYVCIDEHSMQRVDEVFAEMIERETDKAPLYHILARCYEKYGDWETAGRLREQSAKEELKMIHPATQRNYLKLVELLSGRNIKIVAVQYPLRPLKLLKNILKDADAFEEIIFVDNEDSFKRVVRQEGQREYFIDMFGGDFGHCTEKGNRLLANNVAVAIMEGIFGID